MNARVCDGPAGRCSFRDLISRGALACLPVRVHSAALLQAWAEFWSIDWVFSVSGPVSSLKERSKPLEAGGGGGVR